MNAIMVIHPYFIAGAWVFDDAATGLIREPFVAGIPEFIARWIEEQKIKNARKGFTIYFSAEPFPEWQYKITRCDPEHGGTWYEFDGMRGWLCGALFKYFETAPAQIFVKLSNG